jgi:hypothetical protein
VVTRPHYGYPLPHPYLPFFSWNPTKPHIRLILYPPLFHPTCLFLNHRPHGQPSKIWVSRTVKGRWWCVHEDAYRNGYREKIWVCRLLLNPLSFLLFFGPVGSRSRPTHCRRSRRHRYRLTRRALNFGLGRTLGENYGIIACSKDLPSQGVGGAFCAEGSSRRECKSLNFRWPVR